MIASLISTIILSPLALQDTKPRISLTLNPIQPLSEETLFGAIRQQLKMGIESCSMSVKWQDFSVENMKGLNDVFGVGKVLGGDSILVIKTVDTNNRAVPGALTNLKFDDPVFVKQWEDMILLISKNLPKNVKAIALGNEADVYFRDHPGELDAYLELMKSARSLLKGAGVSAPIGIVTTYEGISKDRALAAKLQRGWDVVFMTYYPMNSQFEVLPTTEVAKHLDEMIQFASGRPLILSEVGYPSSELNKSSEEKQAAFVKEFFAQLGKRSNRIPFVNYFIQADFDGVILDYLETQYRLNDERFRAYLSSTGLTKSDGTKKKSYSEFKRVIRELENDQ
jgi:hypothetical protein